jgi:hypothetical protein
MTEKLVMLEERIRETVAGAQTSVEEIVENVKEAVGDTVATVQRTFDLPLQVEQHPWPMVGGALLAGYMLGSWGGGHPSAPGPTAERRADVSRPRPSASRVPSAHPQPQQGFVSGLVEQLKDEMQDEIVSLKNVAVGAVINTLRALFKQAMSTLTPFLENTRTTRGGPSSASPAQHPALMSSASPNGVRSANARPVRKRQCTQPE